MVSVHSNRVMQGGHSIPEAAIRRRYQRGWENLNQIYKDFVDNWSVFDGSIASPGSATGSRDNSKCWVDAGSARTSGPASPGLNPRKRLLQNSHAHPKKKPQEHSCGLFQ